MDGYDIHVQAPHMMPDGTPGGPFHHYCKGVSDQILQCLLFESTDPKAKLIGIEYFVAKELSRKLPPIQWHRYFHDHKVEIATGRVQVLDMPPDQAAKVAEAALGPIDILINNAGVQVIGDTASIDVDEGERSIRLNLLTPLRLTRAVLPGMIARGDGTIVDTYGDVALNQGDGDLTGDVGFCCRCECACRDGGDGWREDPAAPGAARPRWSATGATRCAS